MQERVSSITQSMGNTKSDNMRSFRKNETCDLTLDGLEADGRGQFVAP